MLIEYTCNIVQSNIGALSGNFLATTGEKPGCSPDFFLWTERGDISLSEFKDYNIMLVEFSLKLVLLICLSLMFVVGKR